MLRRLSGRFTYANVVASLALFLALGGGAYAAVRLPSNSVGTNQIKKAAVTQSKIAPSALKFLKGATGPKGDAGISGVPGAQGAQGPKGDAGVPGAQGAQGPKGDQGAQGPAGPTAAAWAHSSGGNGVDTNTYSPIIDLVSVPGTGLSEAHSGAISVPFNARLIANASFAIDSLASGSATIRCKLVLNPGAGAQDFYSGEPIRLAPTAQENASIADGIDVPPGTYNVAVSCYSFGVAGFTAQGQSLTVVAVAR
jgi:hypothetical protein